MPIIAADCFFHVDNAIFDRVSFENQACDDLKKWQDERMHGNSDA